jgi:hypothetical protein
MRRVGYVLLLCVLVFSGCSSLSTWVRSNVEGVPVWVYEPQVNRNQLAYVGVGTASTEARARTLSYESILSQISSFIGEDITSVYFREISSGGTIEEYRLKITQEFVRKDQRGTSVYLLAVGDKDRLDTARTEAEKLLLQQQSQIAGLVAEAAEAYRQNQDYLAAELYIKAAVIASSMAVERGAAAYSTNIARAERIINDLNISVSKVDPKIPNAVVLVRRGNRMLSPKVGKAKVTAYTQARNGLGMLYADFQEFVTDPTGQFTFIVENPGIVGKGEVRLAIEMRSALSGLKTVDPEKAEALQAVLSAKTVSFAYDRVSNLANRGIVVALMEYSLQGQLLASTDANDTFIAESKVDGLGLISAMAQATEDDEDFLEAVRRNHPGSTYLLMGKAGVSARTIAVGEPTVTVTGEVDLLELKTGRLIYATGEIVAVASAKDEKAATKAAFVRFAYIAASILDRELYR